MSLNIVQVIASELSIKSERVQNALDLLIEGATIPFIARYRKEKTDSLDEVQLREISDRYTYITEIEQRKQVILESIDNQNKLTDELKAKIETCIQKTELEDLYLPYKPKRRTKATIARERGLEPLAEFIKLQNYPQAKSVSLIQEAAKYISIEKEIKTEEDALKGAADILAEEIADKAVLRAYLRSYFLQEGIFISRIKNDYPEGSTKYEMYRNFQVSVKKIAPHNLLALFRGEAEEILSLDLDYDEDFVLSYLAKQEIKSKSLEIKDFYQKLLKDTFNRLIKPSLIREIRTEKKNGLILNLLKHLKSI